MVHTLDMVNMLISKESQSICRQLVIGYEFLSYIHASYTKPGENTTIALHIYRLLHICGIYVFDCSSHNIITQLLRN